VSDQTPASAAARGPCFLIAKPRQRGRNKKGRLAAGQNSEPANDWAKMTRRQAGQEPAVDLQVIHEHCNDRVCDCKRIPGQLRNFFGKKE
jgi:hypothetical protein